MRIKHPNGVLYILVYILIYPLLKLLFRLRVDRSDFEKKKGPFLVLSNHASFLDFLLVMLTIYPRRLNTVTAQKFFFYRPLNKLLPLMGCIPKNLFDPDVRSIMRIMAVLKHGGGVLLYPEGRCSTDGAYARIHKSTGKLVKKLGVPVVSCHVEGAFLCMPFWRKRFRTGRIRVTIADLFSGDDLKTLPIEDINDAIDARLSGDDRPAPQKELQTNRAKNLTEGLSNILYLCPKCKAELTMETTGNAIKCTACGNTGIMDRAGRLRPAPDSIIPGTISAWHREQAGYEIQRLSEDMEPIEELVSVRIPSDKPGAGMSPGGKGKLRLDPKGWNYDGTLSGDEVSLFFPIETVPAIPFDDDDNFQIYSGGSFYMFTPEDSRKCAKYSLLGECAHQRFASQVQMTPGGKNGLFATTESS